MDVHPKNGSVVSVHMLKYVTLDLIGYNIYIYTHIYLFIYTCFFVEPVYEVGLGLQMSRTAAGTTVSFRVSLRTC